jgi:uncharacterized protein (TIRG00374 family)
LLLVGAGLFFWVIRAVGWQDVKTAFSRFTFWQALIIIGLTAIIALIDNWKWQVVLKSQRIVLSFKALWKIYLGSYVIRFFTPVAFIGGEVFRSYVLSKNHSVDWVKGVASVIIDRILTYTIYLLIIIWGICLLLLRVGLLPRNIMFYLGGMLFLFGFVIIVFYFKIFKKQSIIKVFLKKLPLKGNGQRIDKALALEKEVFNFFKFKEKTMWQGMILSILRTLFMLLRTWFLVIFLNKAIGLASAVFLLSFTLLSAMIPIPANLGAHDVAQAFAFNALGLGAGTGAAFTMIIRGAEALIALLGFVFLFKLGLELWKKSILKKVNKISL